jgi:hypothetical protein
VEWNLKSWRDYFSQFSSKKDGEIDSNAFTLIGSKALKNNESIGPIDWFQSKQECSL